MRDRHYPILATAITATAILAVVALSSCTATPDGTFMIDHDGDPNTAPIEMTQAQRCAFYNARIEIIDAKEPPLNDYDTAARTGYTTARAIAGCPVADASETAVD